MSVEVVRICPLGVKCEEIMGDKINRCRWYIEIEGVHPQTGKDVSEWDCSFAWMPTLSLEISKTNRGLTSLLESVRNKAKSKATIKEIQCP